MHIAFRKVIMNTRKICIFCETWKSGGIESLLYNCLTHMDLNNLKIDIVAAEIYPSIFTEELKKASIRFFELSGNYKSLRKNYQLFKKLITKEHYDVIHLNVFQGMTLYYAHIAHKAGIPVRIAHGHNTDLRNSLAKPIKIMLHNVYKILFTSDASELWACSSKAGDFCFSKGEKDVKIVPNGIDISRFRFQKDERMRLRFENGISNDMVVGCIGRLCFQKNQTFLLDVFAKLLETQPDSILYIVGDGEDYEMLFNKSKSLGISERVFFLGVRHDVETLMWMMDILAFPSRFEGLGIVAIEAQAAGLPVLCSENVPEEANITPLFSPLNLALGAEAWANRMVELATERKNNEDYADMVKSHGYDISDVAALLENKYRYN